MNLFFVSRRFRRLNVPGALLLAFLQRTPVVRLVFAAESAVAAAPVASLVRSVFALGATLGAIDTMAGATTLDTTPRSDENGVNAAVGDTLNVFFTVNPTDTPVMSWRVASSQFPPGLNFSGLTSTGMKDVTNLNLTGTATQAGTYTMTITAYEFTGGGGISSQPYQYTITITGGTNTAPAISVQPVDQNVAAGGTANFSVTATGTPAPTYQWQKDGNAISGATGSSYSVSSVGVSNAGAYSVVVTNAAGSITSGNAQLNVGPAITAQPQAQTAVAGTAANFNVTATGSPAPTYQWKKSGNTLVGATAATLALSNVSAADAASYTVVVTNSVASVTSSPASLTVTAAPTAPAFTQQPVSQTVLAGAAVSFSATVSSDSSVTYQWKKDGVALANGGNISGATTATLSLASVGAADAGNYTLVATNTAGSTTSTAAALALGTASDPGRIVNMSVLTSIGAGENFTVGYVLGGNGTSGTKPILMRAMGPSLAPLGVNPVLANPYLESYNGSTLASANEDWGGDATIRTVAAAVGAFGFVSDTSKDAALFVPDVPSSGLHSVKVYSHDNSSGAVIAEVYDATPGSAWTTSTPRLINISVQKNVGTLTTVGFAITGSTSVKVLIRAVGPGLAPFGLTGLIDDPKLAVYVLGATAPFDTNDNWGGATQLSDAMQATGAFGIPAGSKDAVLLETLQPGLYTAQVSPSTGNTGVAIIEVYEVP